MKDIFLVNYSVSGIKSIDKTVELSFYKKTFEKTIETSNYNIKGIYGMNGSGKSGIVASVEILKNVLVNANFLNSPIIQKKLNALINKGAEKLSINTEFIAELEGKIILYRYSLTIEKDDMNKYIISGECLQSKAASSQRSNWSTLFLVENGELTECQGNDENLFVKKLKQNTVNLLSDSSLSILFAKKFSSYKLEDDDSDLFISLCLLYIFGTKLYVYVDQSDDHTGYYVQDYLRTSIDAKQKGIEALIKGIAEKEAAYMDVISISGNRIPVSDYQDFVRNVSKLKDFVKIFKSELLDIEIDKKQDRNVYVCYLNMVYDNYKVNVEFESTGIKKLIRLYAYLKKMVNGDIVFIDEFDSNLHDVYLRALLEYLKSYGKGQLCFTTHNVGPMDVLKENKKSLDFLSVDGMIYSWKKNGHYSPSSLYRNGMIEGSPFNVDSIDFIGVFSEEDEEWVSN